MNGAGGGGVGAGGASAGGRVRVVIAADATPMAGQASCGDVCEAFSWSHGVAVAIADGLGHGPSAAGASKAFCTCVLEMIEEPLGAMFARAQQALLKTRGAVAAVARFDEQRAEVEIAGLGNIGVMLLRQGEPRPEHPIIPTGVLGTTFRAVRPSTHSFQLGDLLVMHTDGVKSRFDVDSVRLLSPRAAVQQILTSYGKGHDDSACVVARAERALLSALPPPVAPPQGATRTIPILVRSDVECAATEVRRFAQEAGLPPRAQWEISIATSELATNIVKHAGRGEIRFSLETEPARALVVEAIDQGRGIPDVAAAVVDGFSEGALRTPDRVRAPGQGLGVGLGSVRRMMDGVEIKTGSAGTRIVARKRG